MDESNSKGEKQQKERRLDPELLKEGLRCDLDQYEMLKRCSDKKDITEWNQWRQKHPNEEILLEGACLIDAHLERAKLNMANMGSTTLRRTNMRGANLNSAKLQGAGFLLAIVDGSTLIWYCSVDRDTDFRGVGLNNCRIDPATRLLLEYNIRRKNWEEWYKEHRILRWPVRGFWWISDYGLRTWRIIVTFFALAIAFAVLYWLWPNCVMVNKVVGDIRGFWHALYFSIVTMTTLGFGDIAANPDSWLGQTLLMFQVILGYVLLGALVTRFAVLFTAGGPAGKFADEKTIRQRLKEVWNKIKKKD